jgi:hypothetical protein
MSIDPKETAAFASILGKLDGVSSGETVVYAGATQRMASNDMHSILSAFADTSGTSSALSITPSMVMESQQPVEERAKNPYAIGMAQAMKATGDKPPLKKSTITKAHDIAKAIEKEETNEEESLDEVIRKLGDKYRLYSKKGKNLGTFDTKAGAEKHEREVQAFKHMGEDKISKDRKSLSDYLGDAQNKEDVLGPAIKTVKLNSGKTLKIHGNEDDGFRVQVNDKLHGKTFGNLDDVLMACESFIKRTNRK